MSHPGQPWAPRLRKERTDWRIWMAHALVALAAAVAGLTVVGFSWLGEHAAMLFAQLRAACWWSPILWCPACAAAIVWVTGASSPARPVPASRR